MAGPLSNLETGSNVVRGKFSDATERDVLGEDVKGLRV